MRTKGFMQGREVEFDEISIDQAEDLRAEGATVLDVRRHDERRTKRIPRSLHIPLDELPGKINDLPEGRILVVCATGVRSAVASAMIEESTGRRDVSSIAGGTNEWEVAGKPIDRG